MSIDTHSTTWSQPCVPLVALATKQLVVSLDETEHVVTVLSGKALLGGKGANLALLRAAGLPVPAGLCVTTEAFRRFVDSCAEIAPLWTALAALGPEQVAEAQALAAQVRVCLAAAPLPKAVQTAVVAAWRKLGTSRTYAVR